MSSFVRCLVVFGLALFVKRVTATSPTAAPSSVRSSQNSIITIAGTGVASSTGTDGVATAMTLNHPEGIWVTSMAVVYVAEQYSGLVRKFSYPNGIVFAVAGVSDIFGSSGDNGPATSGLLYLPSGIVVDTMGVVYISDLNNNKVRMVSVSGIITTIAGTGSGSSTGDYGPASYNRPASSAILDAPTGIWIDSLSQLYVTTYYGSIVSRIGSDDNRIITTIAGTSGSAAFLGDGGPATSAHLYLPYSVFVDTVGVVYIGDTSSQRVRRVTTDGIINTVIGTHYMTYNGDQPGTLCNLYYPIGVVVDPSNGDIYVASSNNLVVQVLTATSGNVTVFAGNQDTSYSGEDIAATSAGVLPNYLFLDTNNRLFITDHNSHRVRMTYSTNPTMVPSVLPTTVAPSVVPSVVPTTVAPSAVPSVVPTTVSPSVVPSVVPTTVAPSVVPSVVPTTVAPSAVPFSDASSFVPSEMPAVENGSLSLAPTALVTLSVSAANTDALADNHGASNDDLSSRQSGVVTGLIIGMALVGFIAVLAVSVALLAYRKVQIANRGSFQLTGMSLG